MGRKFDQTLISSAFTVFVMSWSWSRFQIMNHTHTVLLLLNRDGDASISAVLNFRKALAFTQKRYPFSFAFGPAYSREACIDHHKQCTAD
jgi:hypothetical protein